MAFIDIFNYKKYFSSKGDSNVARIGHVNKLANRVTSPTAVTQTGSTVSPVTIDAYAGVITMQSILNTGQPSASFIVNNSFATASSTILFTVEYPSTADVSDRVDIAIFNRTDGSFGINIVSSATVPVQTAPYKIHFLVIS